MSNSTAPSQVWHWCDIFTHLNCSDTSCQYHPILLQSLENTHGKQDYYDHDGIDHDNHDDPNDHDDHDYGHDDGYEDHDDHNGHDGPDDIHVSGRP